MEPLNQIQTEKIYIAVLGFKNYKMVLRQDQCNCVYLMSVYGSKYYISKQGAFLNWPEWLI